MGLLITLQSNGGTMCGMMLIVPQLYFLAISFYVIGLVNDLRASIKKMNETTNDSTLSRNFVQIISYHNRMLT